MDSTVDQQVVSGTSALWVFFYIALALTALVCLWNLRGSMMTIFSYSGQANKHQDIKHQDIKHQDDKHQDRERQVHEHPVHEHQDNEYRVPEISEEEHTRNLLAFRDMLEVCRHRFPDERDRGYDS